jgi:hypothetical protein
MQRKEGSTVFVSKNTKSESSHAAELLCFVQSCLNWMILVDLLLHQVQKCRGRKEAWHLCKNMKSESS